MTTIKITDGQPEDSRHQPSVEVRESEPDDRNVPPSSPIRLTVFDGDDAHGVWLTPAKAREVADALYAAANACGTGQTVVRSPGDG